MRPPARPRARPRPAAASPPEAFPDDDAEIVAPDVAKLRRVLEFTAAGRSQAEIAKAMGCSERSVRRLLKMARQREASTFRARSAEALIADVETKSATNYARMTSAWAKAKATGNLRAEIAILGRMEMVLFGRVAMLARVGFFDTVTFAGHGAEDETTKHVERDKAEIDFLVMLSVATNRGEDVTNLSIEDPIDTADLKDFEPLY